MGLLYKKQGRGLVGSCNAPTIASPGRVTRYLLFKQNPQAMWPYWQQGPMTRVPCIISQLLGFRFTNFWVTPCLYSLQKWETWESSVGPDWTLLWTESHHHEEHWWQHCRPPLYPYPPWWLQLTIILKKWQPPPERILPIEQGFTITSSLRDPLCESPWTKLFSTKIFRDPVLKHKTRQETALHLCTFVSITKNLKKKATPKGQKKSEEC